MGGKTAQGLGVGKHGGGRPAQDIALIHADQGVQHVGVLERIGVGCQLVFRGRAVQEAGEDFGAKGQA